MPLLCSQGWLPVHLKGNVQLLSCSISQVPVAAMSKKQWSGFQPVLTAPVQAVVPGQPLLWLPVHVTIILNHPHSKGRQHRILFTALEGEVFSVPGQRVSAVSAQGGGVKPCGFLTRAAGNVDVLECSYVAGKQLNIIS